MPLYYGYPVSGKNATNIVRVETDVDMVPAEPSSVRVLVHNYVFDPFRMFTSTLMGYMTLLLSFPRGVWTTTFKTYGGTCQPVDEMIPFDLPGLAFAVKKGTKLPDDVNAELEANGFTTLQYAGRLTYTCTTATRDDYIYIVQNVDGLQRTAPVPNRFLNPEAFETLLFLLNLTSWICKAMNMITHFAGREQLLFSTTSASSALTVEGGETLDDYLSSENTPTTSATWHHIKTLPAKLKMGSLIGSIEHVFAVSAHKILGCEDEIGLLNDVDISDYPGWITPSSFKARYHGIVCRYIPALSLPDAGTVSDVLQRYFMQALGEDAEEQISLLGRISTCCSLLRLTELGDQLSHLYKSIGVSLECGSGGMAMFTSKTYEGFVIHGGSGAKFTTSGRSVSFENKGIFEHQVHTMSSHHTALENILRRTGLSGTSGKTITGSTTMYALREALQAAKLNTEDRDYIMNQARYLRFGENESLAVNPANLKRVFSLIANPSLLSAIDPINYQSLFTTDPVWVALSCFGNKEVPSFRIPQGSLQRIGAAPPSTPLTTPRAGKNGLVDDASWTMSVRKTTLDRAVEDFRTMCQEGGYRSVARVLARKQHMFSFDSGRMTVFWGEMLEAVQKTNSAFVIAGTGGSQGIGKRKAGNEDGDDDAARGMPASKKKKGGMKF